MEYYGAGSHISRSGARVLRADGGLRDRLRATLKKEPAMTEPLIGLAVGVLLAVYLIYNLIYPEKF
jgi:K+-transporting ATPase KdpF subunit